MTVYLDDILVTGATDQDHLQNLQDVLTQLEQAGIQLNKCVFLLHFVEYLSHEISEAGLKPAAYKVRALVEAPVASLSYISS